MSAPKLVLGSQSPRRLELLARIGLVPEAIRPAHIDETPIEGEIPRAYCRRVTEAKAQAIDIAADELVLTADTTVAAGRRIMGKPCDPDEARGFLRLLSGRRHKVITCVAARDSRRISVRDVVSTVRFRRLTGSDIENYIDSGEWEGKAGGYAIQGRAETFIPWISGSYSAIMGLPLSETATMLASFGLGPGARA